ncbi:MAG: hypothetical protein QJR02_10165 [Sinobacteraceae bacterium]|nr:hypothetical protein [Nevskiaceae bacterium]
MATPQPFPVNPTLTAIAIGYHNTDDMLIADQVLPRVPVGQKFTWTSYSAEQAYTVPNTQVGRKSQPFTVDFSGTSQTDSVNDYALDDFVPQDDVEAWEAMPKPPTGGPLSPQALATMMLTNLIELDREIRVANLVFNPASYPANQIETLSGTSQWSDYTNSNPLSDLMAALDVPLIRPNTIVMGRQAWTVLRQHPKIVQAVEKAYVGSGVVSQQAVADLLEVKQILVGNSRLNTAKKGQTPSYARVWGKHAALLYVSELAAQTFQPSFGFTAMFGTRIAGDIPELKRGIRGGVTIRVGERVKEIISAPASGYFIQNAVA